MNLYKSDEVKEPDVLLILGRFKLIFHVRVKLFFLILLPRFLSVLPNYWHTVYLARYVFGNFYWWTACWRLMRRLDFFENSTVGGWITKVNLLFIKNQVLIKEALQESALVLVRVEVPSAVLKSRQKTDDFLPRHHFINLEPLALFVLISLFIQRINSVRLYHV
jgi:hypothetical protein